MNQGGNTMSAIYSEPLLTVAVLDFLKPEETRLCLESVRCHVSIPHKTILLHNGMADHPNQLFRDGLVDVLIQTRVNNGLGIGTRDLMAASHSRYTLYLQNDQTFIRDLTEAEFAQLTGVLEQDNNVPTISLAGAPCGVGVFSERAFLVKTETYRSWDQRGLLGYHGAGPYHDGVWREAEIQSIYRRWGLVHLIWPCPLVGDNGRRAVRQNPDGSIWEHYPDTKACWLKQGPVKERHVYPKFTDAEWEMVLQTQTWPPGQIPEQERRESFHVWN